MIFKYKNPVFIAPEDSVFRINGQVKYDDPDVERVRRAHMNDLENIPIFLISSLLFVLTDPNKLLAIMLFRIYATARILHTVVYALIVVQQPARTLCFICGSSINITICILTLMHVIHV